MTKKLYILIACVLLVLFFIGVTGCTMCKMAPNESVTVTPPAATIIPSPILEPSVIAATTVPSPTLTHADIARATLEEKHKAHPGHYSPVEIQGNYLVYNETVSGKNNDYGLEPYFSKSECLEDGSWKIHFGYYSPLDHAISVTEAQAKIYPPLGGRPPITELLPGNHPDAFVVTYGPEDRCVFWGFYEHTTTIQREDVEKIYNGL